MKKMTDKEPPVYYHDVPPNKMYKEGRHPDCLMDGPDSKLFFVAQGTEENKSEFAYPRRELDLYDYVIADFEFSCCADTDTESIESIERGQSVPECMKSNYFKMRIFPDSLDPSPKEKIVWKCEVVIMPRDKLRDLFAQGIVYKGQAVFFRDSKMISLVATNANNGRVDFLLAPRRLEFELDLAEYVVCDIPVFPKESSVQFSVDDIGRPVKEFMESRGFEMELFRRRMVKGEATEPGIVNRACSIYWPFGLGLRCVTRCQAAYDYGTWDICITGEDIRIELERVKPK